MKLLLAASVVLLLIDISIGGRRIKGALKGKTKWRKAYAKLIVQDQGSGGKEWDDNKLGIGTACRGRGWTYASYERPDDNDTVPAECQYLACDRSSYGYALRTCPPGLAISPAAFISRGSDHNPCSKPSHKCVVPLNDTGVVKVPVDVCAIDIVLVADMSCSISIEDKSKVKKFLVNIIRNLDIRPAMTQVAALSYAKNVYHAMYLNSNANAQEAMEEIRDIRTNIPIRECGTATYKALEDARTKYFSKSNGNRPTVEVNNNGTISELFKDVLVLVTDGMTNPFPKSVLTIEQAKLLKQNGVRIIVIKLPNLREGLIKDPAEQKRRRELAEREFTQIPTDASTDLLFLTSFDEFDSIVNQITKKSCYTI